jgi:putative alpha-1,2-mannosidase
MGRSGRVLKIVADGATARSPYVQELSLDGRPHESTWLAFDRFERGATLRFKLSDRPNTRWATSPSAAPPSFDEGMEHAAPPKQ